MKQVAAVIIIIGVLRILSLLALMLHEFMTSDWE